MLKKFPVCNFSKFEIIRFLGCFGVWDTKILRRISPPSFISHEVKNVFLCLLLKICFSFDYTSLLCTTFLLKKNSYSIDIQKVKMLTVSFSPSPHPTLLPISSWSISFVSECLYTLHMCVGVHTHVRAVFTRRRSRYTCSSATWMSFHAQIFCMCFWLQHVVTETHLTLFNFPVNSLL